MENSPLYQAHYHERRAENHLDYKRFDEAIVCYQKAAELLEKALQITNAIKAIESIKLQRDYNLKQKEIVRMKKQQFETIKREALLKKMGDSEIDKWPSEMEGLQTAIFKTMEEADSLLAHLFVKESEKGDSKSNSSSPNRTVDDYESGTKTFKPMGSKQPKDHKVVIEELKTLNYQLHSLVNQLMTQLEAKTKEAESLKDRIKFLESENQRLTGNSTLLTTGENEGQTLNVGSGSSEGNSPFVFSPSTELPEVVLQARDLPVLAPLELPNFDYSDIMQAHKDDDEK